MTTLIPTGCCGIKEIKLLSHSKDPKEALLSLEKSLNFPAHKYGMILFSGVVLRRIGTVEDSRPDNYGEAFSAYITQHGLGTITRSPDVINPNTNNTIAAWIWVPDKEKLKEWYNSHSAPQREASSPPPTGQPPRGPDYCRCNQCKRRREIDPESFYY